MLWKKCSHLGEQTLARHCINNAFTFLNGKLNLKSKRIIFVCPAAYPLFDKGCQHLIGGMETRAALFAKALAKSECWDVFFAVKDYGQPARVKIDGVTLVRYSPLARQITDNVVPRFRKHKWRPVIHLDRRDIHFAWHLPAYLLMRLMPQALVHRFWSLLNPDAVCCFGNNPTSAETIAECNRHDIPSVLFIASDDDLSADYHAAATGTNDYGTPRRMAWYAVTMADHVLVQTNRQRDLLERNFGRSAELIHNPIDISPATKTSWIARKKRQYALWIGRSDAFNKRPTLVLQLARDNPEIPFLMIVNKSDAEVLRQIQLDQPKNVTIIERIPHDEIPRIFRHARIFINTSRYEGFPNTFLQAATHGVPVVSLSVDPEGVLTSDECGLCAEGKLEQLAEMLQTIWRDDSLAEKYAARFFEIAMTRHALASQVQLLESFFDRIAPRKEKRSRPPFWHRPFAHFPWKQ